MTFTVPLPTIETSLRLDGIRWQTYELLQQDLDAQSRRLRLTYYQGELDIMVPSPEHERYKKTVGRFVETLAEEFQIALEPFGSTTFKRPELAGAEPDECFYIRNASAVRGLRRIDLKRDPPPDLAIEIDITHPSSDRLPVYAELGILEVWRYSGNQLRIYILQDKRYVETTESLAFPNVQITELTRFLNRAIETDYLSLVREFREWVRGKYSG